MTLPHTNSIDRLRPAFARLADAVAYWSGFGDVTISPCFDILGERAELLQLPIADAVSANGSCRLIGCRDGWIAVNLPRASDHELVPALIERMPSGEAWQQLEAAAADRTASSLVTQAALLGLAVAEVGETRSSFVLPDRAGAARAWERRPLVVDLSALWAGPLCSALLAEAGCAVTKVESVHRPDSTAASSAAFDARLNGRKARMAIDPRRPGDLGELRHLIRSSDLVITSARPRGLASLGIEETLHAHRGAWIAITAHADSDRIGFGDDCAAAAGLLDWTDTQSPHFLGDAIADPLTGLAAAAAALAALATQKGGRQGITLSAVSHAVANWKTAAQVGQ